MGDSAANKIFGNIASTGHHPGVKNIAHRADTGKEGFAEGAAEGNSAAICVLGMHRSGTSAVTRAVSLLGVHLGDDAKMMPPNAENPGGYWELLEINSLHKRLMAGIGRDWDTANPLPERWLHSLAARPFSDELAGIVAANFGGQLLWAWKEPRTCLLLPLWREVLEQSKVRLQCLFVVRSPVDVAGSLMRRDAIPFGKGLGIWFHYNIVALRDAADLPTVFLSYERLLAAWEPELRRCAAGLGLEWPKDDAGLRKAMDSFIDPNLRHNRSTAERLKELPAPAQELYQALSEACLRDGTHHKELGQTVQRLHKEYHAYASLFELKESPPAPGRLMRVWRRWQRSLRKRLPKRSMPSAG